MRWRLLAAALEASALACGVVAYLRHDDEPEPVIVGGNTRDGNLESPPLAEDTGSWFEPFDFGNPYLWLGAGSALALAGVLVLVLSLRRS